MAWVSSTPLARPRPLAKPCSCGLQTRPAYVARRPHRPRWHARAPKSATPDAAETELVTSLLQTTGELQALCEYRVEKFPKQEDLFASALDLASQLESSRAGFGGQRLEKLLPGRWRLLLTNSPPVIKNAGSITGLGALPGAKCSKVEVVLERGGRASTEEAVSVLGLMNGVNALTGKWRLGGKGNSVLEVTYAEASLMGKSKFRADSKAVLETTYCGDQIRIGRSKTGDVFVFQRV